MEAQTAQEQAQKRLAEAHANIQHKRELKEELLKTKRMQAAEVKDALLSDKIKQQALRSQELERKKEERRKDKLEKMMALSLKQRPSTAKAAYQARIEREKAETDTNLRLVRNANVKA